MNDILETIKKLTWETSDILSTIAIFLSVFFSGLTIILTRKEKPNVMPYGQNVFDSNHLVIDFNNPSDTNLHDLTLLINGFDSEFNEISSLHFQDKYLFTISAKSMFNYGFNVNGEWSTKNFFFRVRLKGKYFSRFPIFATRKFEQIIWYSAIVQKLDGEKVSIKILTTHRDEICRLESKHKVALEEYEKNTDKKFKK